MHLLPASAFCHPRSGCSIIDHGFSHSSQQHLHSINSSARQADLGILRRPRVCFLSVSASSAMKYGRLQLIGVRLKPFRRLRAAAQWPNPVNSAYLNCRPQNASPAKLARVKWMKSHGLPASAAWWRASAERGPSSAAYRPTSVLPV
jgi:hypothetical protein